MKSMQRNWATRAITELMAWYFRVSFPAIPICPYMVTEKYCIAET
jgi:hypothetical protein